MTISQIPPPRSVEINPSHRFQKYDLENLLWAIHKQPQAPAEASTTLDNIKDLLGHVTTLKQAELILGTQGRPLKYKILGLSATAARVALVVCAILLCYAAVVPGVISPMPAVYGLLTSVAVSGMLWAYDHDVTPSDLNGVSVMRYASVNPPESKFHEVTRKMFHALTLGMFIPAARGIFRASYLQNQIDFCNKKIVEESQAIQQFSQGVEKSAKIKTYLEDRIAQAELVLEREPNNAKIQLEKDKLERAMTVWEQLEVARQPSADVPEVGDPSAVDAEGVAA